MQKDTGVKRRGEWWVALVGLLLLAFLFFYNRQPYAAYTLQWLGVRGDETLLRGLEEYIVVNTACLLWIPVMMIALIGKGDLSQYGLTRGDGKNGALLALLMYAAMFIPLWFASDMPVFKQYYPLDKRVLVNGAYAVYFELIYGYYLFCWEFFFRGFLTFALYRWLGWTGIVFQAAAFGLMHVGKPVPEMLGSFVAGVILGWVAIRVKSFLPCFWAHWAISMTMDLLLIFRYHQGN